MIVLYLAASYLLIGFVFAIPFLVRWVTELDSAARESTLFFRVILLPGTVVFWPVLLRKVVALKKGRP